MNQVASMMALLATTAVLAWGVAAWVLRRADALRLVQMPSHRSSHVHPTPTGGGLGIVVAGSPRKIPTAPDWVEMGVLMDVSRKWV